jgi:hypothetical protein
MRRSAARAARAREGEAVGAVLDDGLDRTGSFASAFSRDCAWRALLAL